MDQRILIEGLLVWGIFGFSHSLLATKKFREIIPLKGRNYRIVYNIISTFTFLWVVWITPPLELPDSNSVNLTPFKIVVTIFLLLIAGGFGIFGLRAWDLKAFLGFKEETGELVTSGIYAVARHPVYTGAIAAFAVLYLLTPTVPNLILLAGGGGYFIIGSVPEEYKLESHFIDYKEYKENVGRFFPWKKRHFNFLFRS